MQAQSLGQKDPLEKEMATHSHILVWRIPWTEEPGGRQSMGSWTWLRQLNMHAQQPIPQLQGSLALFQKSTLMPSVSSFPASQPTSHSQLQAQNVCFLFMLHRNPEHVERTKFRPSHCRASSVWFYCGHLLVGASQVSPSERQGTDFPTFSLYYGACVLSGIWLNETSWTIAPQGPLSMGFPKQEHWSGEPFPPPGDLPDPGIQPVSPASSALQVDF